MGIHYDYKSTKGNKLMEKQAKRERKLAEKKAKRLAFFSASFFSLLACFSINLALFVVLYV